MPIVRFMKTLLLIAETFIIRPTLHNSCKMEVTKKELRENIKFFTLKDPIGKIVYKRLEKL